MTASNPTPDDLRTIAKNLLAEGQTSRADVILNAAKRIERLELYLSQFREFAKEISEDIENDIHRMREYFNIGKED